MKKVAFAFLILFGIAALGIGAQIYLSPTFAQNTPNPNPP
jgi:hypothetical protein